jgi:DNA-binding beta-propeller fold protein YncE
VRQGRWAEDLDGDGIEESFRFEITQVLVGIETLTLPSGDLSDVARFRNVTTLTLQASNRQFESEAVVGTEETWWAPGIGLVRADRSVLDGVGTHLVQDHSLVLTGGSVGGFPLFQPRPDGVLQKIPLPHNALVYDAQRQLYYASVPGSVVGNGNHIAVIDAATGTVSYSAGAVGSEPFALALAADGSALYVGMNGSGDVLKLRTSDFAELWRVRLPDAGYLGQKYADYIAVSPHDADVIAVSMFHGGYSSGHAGVALVRAGVLQPVMTQEHTVSNLITFGADGQFVYGFNNENSEFGLRRIAVLADGLQVDAMVYTSGGYGARALDWSSNGLVLGQTLYRTPDLMLLGQVDTGGNGDGCRALTAPNRLVCTNSAAGGQDPRLVVVDASTFAVLATPVYERTCCSFGVPEVVPGPSGQVALRVGADYIRWPATALWLFTSDQLT